MVLSELGNVINPIMVKRKLTLKVLWDAIPKLNQEQQTIIQILQESMWNKDIEHAWRMIFLLFMIIVAMKVICNKV